MKPVLFAISVAVAAVSLTACGGSSTASGGLSDADKAVCNAIKALTVSGAPDAENPVAAQWNAVFSQAENLTDNPDLAKVGSDFNGFEASSWSQEIPFRDRALKICGN